MRNLRYLIQKPLVRGRASGLVFGTPYADRYHSDSPLARPYHDKISLISLTERPTATTATNEGLVCSTVAIFFLF